MENCKNKIVQLRWIGRFGNRMFQYAFGCAYAKKFNCIYYMPSEWEGTYLFCENKYVKIITDDTLRLYISHPHYVTEYSSNEAIINSFENYKNRTNDNIEYVTMQYKENIGKKNIAFNDLNCMYFSHCFDLIDDELLLEIFKFNENILNSNIYKYYSSIKHTYNVVHLRRGDISCPDFNGAYSMISVKSYMDQIKKLKLNKKNFIWISDTESKRRNNEIHKYYKKNDHKFTYPQGEDFIPNTEHFFDFLPDFLLIYFAKIVIRGNSSFSWWASCLGDSIVYAPILEEKPIELKEKFYEMDVKFMEGNSSHFVFCIKDESYLSNIVLKNCNKYNK